MFFDLFVSMVNHIDDIVAMTYVSSKEGSLYTDSSLVTSLRLVPSNGSTISNESLG